MRIARYIAALMIVIGSLDVSAKEEALYLGVAPEANDCEVEKMTMSCDVVGTYLRDSMRIPSKRAIKVVYSRHSSGTNWADAHARILRVVAVLKRVGFSDVSDASIGFIIDQELLP